MDVDLLHRISGRGMVENSGVRPEAFESLGKNVPVHLEEKKKKKKKKKNNKGTKSIVENHLRKC